MQRLLLAAAILAGVLVLPLAVPSSASAAPDDQRAGPSITINVRGGPGPWFGPRAFGPLGFGLGAPFLPAAFVAPYVAPYALPAAYAVPVPVAVPQAVPVPQPVPVAVPVPQYVPAPQQQPTWTSAAAAAPPTRGCPSP